MVQDQAVRGHKEVTQGAYNDFGPIEGGTMTLSGVVAEGKIEVRSMSAGRGDVVEFNLGCGQRARAIWKVSCFGSLATVVGDMVRKGMRLSVEGRPRQRVRGTPGREVVDVDCVAWEIGIWDDKNQIHWLQYDRNSATVQDGSGS